MPPTRQGPSGESPGHVVWKAELGIPADLRTFAVVPVGWPRGGFGPVRRRPVAEVFHRDRW